MVAKKGSDGRRPARVAERIFQALNRLLSTLEDPRLHRLTVSRVDTSPDLGLASVYVQVPDGGDAKASLKALGLASKRLRQQVARAVNLKYAPDLRFFIDEGPGRAARVEELLREIADERADQHEAESAPTSETSSSAGAAGSDPGSARRS